MYFRFSVGDSHLWIVGATLAKRLLILVDGSAVYGKPAKGSFFTLVEWNVLDPQTFLTSADSTALPPLTTDPPVTQYPTIAKLPQTTLNKALDQSQQIPTRLLPHALAKDERFLPDSPIEDFILPVGGVEYGNWWHEIIEKIPWTQGPAICKIQLQDTLDSLPDIPGMQQRATNEITCFLASDTFAWLTSNQIAQTLVEVPFAHICNDSEWMEGIIDLIIITHNSEVIILDWKTNRPAKSENETTFAQHLTDTYRLQLAAYADAVQSATNRKVTKRLLFSTALGIQIEAE